MTSRPVSAALPEPVPAPVPAASDPPGPVPGIGIVLPPRWPTRQDPDLGVLVAARCPRTGRDGHPPEIVLRAVPVAEPGLHAWRDGSLARLAELLDDFAVEDDDTFAVEGEEVRFHRFAHRADGGAVRGADLLSEQWCWWVDGVGVTLTCTVERADYPAYCDLFDDVAATVELLGSGHPAA